MEDAVTEHIKDAVNGLIMSQQAALDGMTSPQDWVGPHTHMMRLASDIVINYPDEDLEDVANRILARVLTRLMS